MFEEIKESARARYIPIIRDESLGLLLGECEKINPKHILEIGTAIGYSSLAMLSACGAHITTIEKDETRFHEALANFEKYNCTHRMTVILGDAADVIKSLNGKFDLIFLDGAKGQYIKYLPRLKQLLSVGGTLIADNIYLHGMVQSEEKIPHKHRSMVMNLRAFIEALKNDPDLETTFVDLEDGMSISKMKQH